MLKLVAFCAMLVALQLVSAENCWQEHPGYRFPSELVVLIPDKTAVRDCKMVCLKTEGCRFVDIVNGKCYMPKSVNIDWSKIMENQPNAVHYYNCQEGPNDFS
ncbi:hypothetical protein HELRODRAFT_160814 [Helobdella robusta]|uniref:Apple domain-containing protein n=1 Tax=Helobdella robusta TaxID=6412 RepID=T1EQR6_HELRO|nr:hypothetical protein HELRODRAFT_160814 [Helobdella robusta]ESO06624.1 hypothetical protein HELRODRAFT_160814 [Helobdella robusta]